MRAKVSRRRNRVRLAVRALGVHVDEAHLHRTERIFQLAVAGIALIVQPLFLGTPVDILFGFPDVHPATTEAEGLEAHRLERDIAREDDQVAPGDLAAVLLLDRPEKPARLVEVAVVGPTV
jgi:hypothetical protein